MIDEKELWDIKRWHRYEGGLDNRRQVIDRMIDTIEALLKVARAAESLLSRTDLKSMLPAEIDDLKDALATLREGEKK